MNRIPLLLLGLLAGCSGVQGFQYTDNGPMSASDARQAAIVAEHEASALREIANEQDRTVQSAADSGQEIARILGAPELVSGLIGAAAGLFVPSPGQRRKQRELEAQAAAGEGKK